MIVVTGLLQYQSMAIFVFCFVFFRSKINYLDPDPDVSRGKGWIRVRFEEKD